MSGKLSYLRPQLSKLKTHMYRQPKAELLRLARWGPLAYLRCGAWAREMEQAVKTLSVPEGPVDRQQTLLSIWYLTGGRFWYQTAFCAWTLAMHSGRRIELNIVDDGSLESGQLDELRRLFPLGRTLQREQIAAELEQHLPESRFPVLRARWLDYVNIRKLIDIHLGSSGPKLVLDSDMLFFKSPTSLLAWHDSPFPGRPICLMTDCVESYGYSRSLLEKICGAPIPPRLNVGVCGIRSETIDWEELESWSRSLLEKEGTSYFLEQALMAMLAARNESTVMPEEAYITFPSRQQVRDGHGVLQHYVADSKPWYFGEAWKLARIRALNAKGFGLEF